jgi:5-formyltetrahydrofolate cyclo-ligase
MKLQEAKQALRKDMASLKRSYEKTTLLDLSVKIMSRLEETELFQQASCIALYHALPGEVQTADFIEKWYRHKRILLPVVKGNDLQLFIYTGKESLKNGAFGILEPSEDSTVPKEDIDLVIVPGVAFDRQHNRLGRGKGFYDRLLSTLSAPKIGICYSFQLKEHIPTEPFDKKMDLILTEKETL